MTDAVYFDLDGTLFDDRQYIRGGLQYAGEVLAAQRGVDLTDELHEAYFERGVTESTFDTVLSEHGLPTDLVPTLVEAYHNNNAELSPFSDTVPTLEMLAREYPLGVITGGTNGREKLSRLGLNEFFETVFVGPTYGAPKRDAEIFQAALRALDASSSDSVYVGDRPALDFPQPNRLGMTTVRISTGRYASADATGEAQPDHTLDRLMELPALVDSFDSTTSE